MYIYESLYNSILILEIHLFGLDTYSFCVDLSLKKDKDKPIFMYHICATIKGKPTK